MMKAIILASGVGKRLQPLIDQLPKTLLIVGDKAILDYQLDSLIQHGISKVIITTGPFREKLEEHVQRNYDIKTQFIHNPKFETTNYIYTLWLVKDLIDSDMLLLHGDLLFDDALIGKLIEAEGNRVLVNHKIRPPQKDFKALIKNNRILKIGVNLFDPNAYFCAPLYKFTKGDFQRWLAEIDDFVKQGNVNCYAEDAFNRISKEIILYPLYFEGFCMEIDTVDDFDKAKVYLQNRTHLTPGMADP